MIRIHSLQIHVLSWHALYLTMHAKAGRYAGVTMLVIPSESRSQLPGDRAAQASQPAPSVQGVMRDEGDRLPQAHISTSASFGMLMFLGPLQDSLAHGGVKAQSVP